ncbi:MAG: DUF1800 domain-containing protein [Bacteroidota bacterium]
MDRRTTLASLFGRTKSDKIIDAMPTAASTVLSGLDPYTGPFEYEHAAHLLRRTIFGPTYQQIKDAVTNGLDATLTTLLADRPLPPEPTNVGYAEDPEVPIGESWVDKPYTQGANAQMILGYRRQSLVSWTVERWRKDGLSVREKMTLFWHNHYVTANINDPNHTYRYITTLRENALGNFKELTKMITIDLAMLQYLNGNQNTAVAPNENYARELLELFSIGKGPAVGPGDYTNYTEDDVVAMAKVLTGWRNTAPYQVPATSVFINGRHDQSTKQLSHRFDNIDIPNMGENEYAHLIDIIYQKDECARFICRKLYRWFVYYVISPDIEANVIEPMAQIMIDNDYEVKPALEALLASEHFFDMLSIGPMIKNPIDFVMSVLNTFEVEYNESDQNTYYRILRGTVGEALETMQMVPFNPPSVAGWKAYYQEPVYYRNWISSATLPPRMNFSNQMLTLGFGQGVNNVKIDVLKFTASLDNPFDPNELIDEFTKILYPQPISDEQKALLKSILIPGLPDFEWTVEYGDYINNPDDVNLEAAVRAKLENMLGAMLSMPEFYLS